MFDFTGKVVVVTGAAGNLGSAVARAFAGAGAHLVLVDRGEGRLAAVNPELAVSGDHILANSIDLVNEESVNQMVASAVGRFERIDVLANTVGGYRAGTPLHETALGTWDFMMDLNAKTAFIISKAVIPYMLVQGSGKIVNVAARAGLSGGAQMSAYSASKSALIRLTESMAAELKTHGINVNCILPGTIDSPDNRAAMPKADFARWVKPESLADVILFLASEAARDIHGASIPVVGRS